MQYKTYNNLDLRLTFNSILSLFTKFWITEVIYQKSYTKIWLTILVYNSNNKAYTLINNLPFYINGYTDILILVKQVLYTNIFNDRYILNRIVFKYYLEPRDSYKRDLHIINMYTYIYIVLILLLLFWVLIVFIGIYSTYNFESFDKEIINNAFESLKESNYIDYEYSSTKQFFFSPFIDLFNGTIIPSKFIDKNLVELDLLKPLVYPNNLSNSETISVLFTDIGQLNNRILEYENLVSDLMKIVEKNPLEK